MTVFEPTNASIFFQSRSKLHKGKSDNQIIFKLDLTNRYIIHWPIELDKCYMNFG